MLKGKIRVFPYFTKNGFDKPYMDMNILVHAYSSPYKSIEKIMLFEIAELAKTALNSVEYDIVSVDFRKYTAGTKLEYLCKLQRYAQSKGYLLQVDPIKIFVDESPEC